jgi:hypothetical protein
VIIDDEFFGLAIVRHELGSAGLPAKPPPGPAVIPIAFLA